MSLDKEFNRINESLLALKKIVRIELNKMIKKNYNEIKKQYCSNEPVLKEQ